MSDKELLVKIEFIRDTLISVSTGRQRIEDINSQYQATYGLVTKELASRKIYNPIEYTDLWDWYGRWKKGDLLSYQSRRSFVGNLINPLIKRIMATPQESIIPTGWPRVDRAVDDYHERLVLAQNEEQFQAVGLLCRETMISLAQAVYNPEGYPSLDGVIPSNTDGKRMFEAYIAVELGGGANEEARKYARSALDLANFLQHHRTANFRDAALCVEATTSVINVIAILAGRRDPQ